MKHTLFIALLGVAAGYFFVAMFAAALFWPVKTIELKNYSPTHPLEVKTKSLYPGDTLIYDLSYCKHTDRTSIVKRELIDGQVISLQDIPGQLPVGCYTTEIRTVVIPETLVPGQYRLSVSIDYPINPIRDAFFGPERTRYTTEYFTVLAEEQPATALIYGQPTPVIIKPAPPVKTPDVPQNGPAIIINNDGSSVTVNRADDVDGDGEAEIEPEPGGNFL